MCSGGFCFRSGSTRRGYNGRDVLFADLRCDEYGAFAVVQLIARAGDRRTSVEDYSGIGFESPVLAFSLSLFLPVFGYATDAGFMGKILDLARLLISITILVVVGVLNTAISAYYYLRLIIVMFFAND